MRQGRQLEDVAKELNYAEYRERCGYSQAIDEIAARPVKFDKKKVAYVLAKNYSVFKTWKKQAALLIAALPQCLKDASEEKKKK